ncbi:MAG: DUF4335 domain-containing protein [Cyanobacteria bacterium J06638_22]
MTTAVLRRYTPPTCTLEVKAKNSPLSRWTQRTVVRDVRFRLSFDDPQRPEAEAVQVIGDRTQLEALTDAVREAVQSLLNPAPSTLAKDVQSFAALLGNRETEAGEALGQNGAIAPPEAVTPTVTTTALAIAPKPHTTLPAHASETGIFVESQGLLSHVLYLGTLATPASGRQVNLSTTQLYDLANALDDYAAEAFSLPDQKATAGASPLRWASIAAVALVALGATGGLARFVMDIANPPMEVAAEAEIESAAAEDFSLDEEFSNLEPLPVPSEEELLEVPETADGVPIPPIPPGGTVQPGTVPPQAYAGFPPGAVVPRSPAEMRPGGGVPVVPANPQLQAQPAPSAPPAAIALNPQALADADSVDLSQASGLPAPSAAAPETLNDAVESAPSTAAQATPQQRSSPINRSGEAPDLPQLTEVRSYFQEQWQPPDALNDTLEYRLVIGATGELQQILPMGQVAGLYIDRTDMPLLGETFVSPLTPYQQATIRLVLAPDGRVQTFLEQLN